VHADPGAGRHHDLLPWPSGLEPMAVLQHGVRRNGVGPRRQPGEDATRPQGPPKAAGIRDGHLARDVFQAFDLDGAARPGLSGTACGTGGWSGNPVSGTQSLRRNPSSQCRPWRSSAQNRVNSFPLRLDAWLKADFFTEGFWPGALGALFRTFPVCAPGASAVVKKAIMA